MTSAGPWCPVGVPSPSSSRPHAGRAPPRRWPPTPGAPPASRPGRPPPPGLAAGVAPALGQAAGAGVWTVGLDARGEALVSDLMVADRPLVLVLGAEDTGLARLVRARCDIVARVPMPGPVESLNVAAAAAV